MLASYVLQIVYGTSDANILQIFRTLICACFVTMPSMLMGYPFLAAMGHPLFTKLDSDLYLRATHHRTIHSLSTPQPHSCQCGHDGCIFRDSAHQFPYLGNQAFPTI